MRTAASLLLFLAVSSWAAPAKVPQRIVTLAPSLGELASDLLGTDVTRIVGVSEFSDFPPGLKSVASVGSYVNLNLEKILSLKPDLVLATFDGNSKEQIDHLKELGLTVLTVRSGSFAEIQDAMVQVATALGVREAGVQMAMQFQRGVERFKQKASRNYRKRQRVLLQVGASPIVVAGGGSILNEVLSTLGVENVYGASQVAYPRPSYEDAVAKDPDAIVVLKMGGESEVTEGSQALIRKWMQYPKLKAVRWKRVQVLKSDALLRPTVRLLEGIGLLERAIYGGTR